MIMRTVMASTSFLSHLTSGNSLATSAAISSHITMAWRCALLLVMTVSSLRGRDWASLNAKRMMRSTPARVIIDTSVAASIGQALVDAPADAGIFALGVLAHDDPVQVSGPQLVAAGRRCRAGSGSGARWRTGRALADLQAQAPEGDVIGNVRVAGRAEQDGVELAERVGAVVRHHDAVLTVIVRPSRSPRSPG